MMTASLLENMIGKGLGVRDMLSDGSTDLSWTCMPGAVWRHWTWLAQYLVQECLCCCIFLIRIIPCSSMIFSADMITVLNPSLFSDRSSQFQLSLISA